MKTLRKPSGRLGGIVPTAPGSAWLAGGIGALPEIDLPAVRIQAIKASAWTLVNHLVLTGGNRLKGSLLQRLRIIRVRTVHDHLLIGFSEKHRLQKPKDALNHGKAKRFPT